jgi:3-deoxy-manno-octulosonate cytidylyltransferase (CMP-KDO synthetase)
VALCCGRFHSSKLEGVHIAIVIPARMGSTRFPGKPLIDLAGKPMIQWVVEAARRAQVTDRIIVATPDEEIIDACRRFGAEAMLTRADHPSGTDRLAEVSRLLRVDVLINVQGDEPLIDPTTIRACAEPLARNPILEMTSVYASCAPDEMDSSAVVKVVTDQEGFALYFSRFAIPYHRNKRPGEMKKHVGIYGYTRSVLARFSNWPVGELEAAESLEQLRFLENGVKIKMVHGQGSALAVDTPEQANEVRRVLASARS